MKTNEKEKFIRYSSENILFRSTFSLFFILFFLKGMVFVQVIVIPCSLGKPVALLELNLPHTKMNVVELSINQRHFVFINPFWYAEKLKGHLAMMTLDNNSEPFILLNLWTMNTWCSHVWVNAEVSSLFKFSYFRKIFVEETS